MVKYLTAYLKQCAARIRAIDLHDLDIKNESAGLLDEKPFEVLCIRFTYQRFRV